ncbi:MAG: hypothetical protein ABR909_02635 [Candidatus Bathyarchaeia archaeon]|jgi:hypothetical protein
MKQTKQERKAQPVDTLLSDSFCSNQIFYNDLEKQPKLFSKQLAYVTAKSQ